MPTDKQRLNWLFRNKESLLCLGRDFSGHWWALLSRTLTDDNRTPRQAIDAAMKASKHKRRT